MSSLLVLNHYLVWHYSTALVLIARIWRNFLWFTVHFFSIPLLLTSLFSPFKRMTEPTKRWYDLEALGTMLVIGFFSRLVGAIARLTLIAIGIATLTVEVLAIVFVYLFWLLAPALIVVLFVWGILLIV